MSDHITDHQPYEKSVTHLQEALYKYCLSLTKSRWDAEDLAQDAWLRILLKEKTDHGNLQALLLRTAKNVWIDGWRRKQAWSRVLEQHVNLQYDQASSVEWDMIKDDVLDAIVVLMDSLTPLQRIVFIMRSVFGYSAKETAGYLCTTEGAVKAAYFRAQQHLREEREVSRKIKTDNSARETLGKGTLGESSKLGEDSTENSPRVPSSDNTVDCSPEFDNHVREIADAITEGNMEEVIELVGQPLKSLEIKATSHSGVSMMMVA